MSEMMEVLDTIPKQDYNLLANYFEKKTGKHISNAKMEFFEILRSSKINKSVQNVIFKSQGHKLAAVIILLW